MKRMLYAAGAVLALALSVTPLRAVTPAEMLSDTALETRARAISAELRCLVCQNQSIDDSDADLAHDLRVLVRDRIKAGDTDAQVRDYLVARYGEFVLLKPRFNTRNAILWVAPVGLLLAGGTYAWVATRRRNNSVAPLSEAEQRRLAAILEEGS